MESLQSHCIHTQFHWSSGPPVCFPLWGTQVQSPGDIYVKLGFSCCRCLATLMPRRDWSLWPRLRWASSQTVTRPSCQQCDNPTWSHTALLSQFHARCMSSFLLHNWYSQLLGRNLLESLQSCCIHTQLHWSSGPPVCFPSWGTRAQPQGVLMWIRNSPFSVGSLQHFEKGVKAEIQYALSCCYTQNFSLTGLCSAFILARSQTGAKASLTKKLGRWWKSYAAPIRSPHCTVYINTNNWTFRYQQFSRTPQSFFII